MTTNSELGSRFVPRLLLTQLNKLVLPLEPSRYTGTPSRLNCTKHLAPCARRACASALLISWPVNTPSTARLRMRSFVNSPTPATAPSLRSYNLERPYVARKVRPSETLSFPSLRSAPLRERRPKPLRPRKARHCGRPALTLRPCTELSCGATSSARRTSACALHFRAATARTTDCAAACAMLQPQKGADGACKSVAAKMNRALY